MSSRGVQTQGLASAFAICKYMPMERTASSLIVERGDYEAVAAKLGIPAGTVAAWKSRNSIPRRNWPEIIDAFPDLTMDELRATERAA
jgi:hypothetical protein